MMTYVAIAYAPAIIALVAMFARIIDRRDRQHARERDLLLNQVMHLAGRTWQQPPAVPQAPEPEPPDDRYVALPEHDMNVY